VVKHYQQINSMDEALGSFICIGNFVLAASWTFFYFGNS